MRKFFIFLVLFSASLYAQKGPNADQAQGKEKEREPFVNQLKKQEEHLVKRLTELRESISCFEKATTEAAQSKCRDEFKSKRKAMKKELSEKMNNEKSHRAKEKKDKPAD